MTTNIHAESNRVIANYLNKEVTVKLTRSDVLYIAGLLRADLNSGNYTDEGQIEIARLHARLVRLISPSAY